MCIENFPIEIWIEITKYTDCNDILKLRFCSRKLNNIITSSELWRKRCYKNWFEHLENDPFNTSKDITKCKNTDWFRYYCERKTTDNDIFKSLKKVLNFLEPIDNYQRNCLDLIERYSDDILIPALYNISKIDPVIENRSVSFELISLSKRLLNSIRINSVLKLLEEKYNDTICDFQNLEGSFLLKFSAIDPGFDCLLKFRTLVIRLIHESINSRYSSYECFIELPILLRSISLLNVVKKTIFSKQYGYDGYKIEDFNILRVYAAECKGLPLIKLSIIQSIFRIYRIDSVITDLFITIRDQNRKHVIYVFCESDGNLKIVNKKQMKAAIDSNVRNHFQNYDKQKYIRELFSPISISKLKLEIISDIANQYKISIWDSVDYATKGDVRLSCFNSSKDIMEIGIIEICFYIVNFNCSSLKDQLDSSGDTYIDKKFYFNDLYLTYPLLNYGKDLLLYYGYQVPELLFDFGKNYWRLGPVRTVQNQADIGKFFLVQESKCLTCFIGTVLSTNGVKSDSFIDVLGNILTSRNSSAKFIHYTPTLDDITIFIRSASILKIGVYFESIDWHSRNLVPNTNYTSWLQQFVVDSST